MAEQRRRKRTAEWVKSEKPKLPTGRVKRWRKKREQILKTSKNLAFASFMLAFFFLLFVAVFIQGAVSGRSKGFFLHSSLGRFRRAMLEHQGAYDAALRHKGDYQKGERAKSIGEDKRLERTMASSRYNRVARCSLTILFMDPRISLLGPGEPAWFALESAALHTDDQSCFLIQTSSCEVVLDNSEHQAASDTILHNIYQQALPSFRKAILQNRVRVTILDYTKYNMKSCNNFDQNAAFMNVNYWKDEFTDLDSDMVMVMQADTVLCHNFELEKYRRFAYVGAVWPAQASLNFPHPMEGTCLWMPNRWRMWLRTQKRWEKQQELINKGKVPDKLLPRPRQLLNSDFPVICKDGIAPVGNGGLSLRNRSWMSRAIEACPHDKYSALDDLKDVACKVLEDVNEDLYFGTVLRGLNAPLPTGIESALFSAESLWAEEVLIIYGGTPFDKSSHISIRYAGNELTVPVGFHKPWAYHSNELLRSSQLNSACPLLRYMFDPEQNRNDTTGSQ